MKLNEHTIHRSFIILKHIERDATFTLRAQFRTGRTLTQKVTLSPRNFKTEIFAVDFFALQETAE